MMNRSSFLKLLNCCPELAIYTTATLYMENDTAYNFCTSFVWKFSALALRYDTKMDYQEIFRTSLEF